jgi:hypothetical protein
VIGGTLVLVVLADVGKCGAALRNRHQSEQFIAAPAQRYLQRWQTSQSVFLHPLDFFPKTTNLSRIVFILSNVLT